MVSVVVVAVFFLSLININVLTRINISISTYNVGVVSYVSVICWFCGWNVKIAGICLCRRRDSVISTFQSELSVIFIWNGILFDDVLIPMFRLLSWLRLTSELVKMCTLQGLCTCMMITSTTSSEARTNPNTKVFFCWHYFHIFAHFKTR